MGLLFGFPLRDGLFCCVFSKGELSFSLVGAQGLLVMVLRQKLPWWIRESSLSFVIKVCAYCNVVNEADANYCDNCGLALIKNRRARPLCII